MLFNDTVEYNIAYGRPGSTGPRWRRRAGRTYPRLHCRNAQGLRHHGRRAGSETVGRRKAARGIARTLLKNPPIVIFDEATSALDSANERAIQAELQGVSQNKTTLVIATACPRWWMHTKFW